MHVAIQVQKQRFRCWINELNVFDVPKGVPAADTMNQLRFEVGATNYPEESYGVFISNVRIATGLQEDPAVRIRITGHTSSDGDDAANLELSKQRAAAVKDRLATDWKIAAHRLETDGKGETEPIADNKTNEGRTQNRRVEFVKL